MKRAVVVLATSLLALSGCAVFGGATVSEVCRVDSVGDVFGSTGTFETAEAALGSVVDDPEDYERVGTEAGRPLFAGPHDPPAQVVELEQDEDGWSVFAVSTCRR